MTIQACWRVKRNFSPTYGNVAILTFGLIISASMISFLFSGFVFIFTAFVYNSPDNRSNSGRSLDLHEAGFLNYLAGGVFDPKNYP